MAKINKPSVKDIVFIAVAVVCAILIIVGVCVTYIKFDYLGYTENYKLSYFSDLQKSFDEKVPGFDAMNAFAIITLVVSLLSAIALVICKLLNFKASKIVLIVLGALTVIFAVVALATGYSFCNNEENNGGYDCLKPAAGCWLVFIFGLISGIVTVLAAMGKKAAE